MKKILFLLIFVYTSSFAVSYFCGATEPSQYAGYGGAESPISVNAYSNRSYSSWSSATSCSDRQDYWAVVPASGSAEKYIFHHYDSYSSNRVYIRTTYTLINQPIPPTCDPDTEVLNTETNTCDCKSGFITDPATNEGCVPDCSLSAPEPDSVPLGWVSYVDVYNTVEDCQAKASQFPSNEFSFSVITPDDNNPNCTHSTCNVNEYVNDPCISADSPNYSSSYVLKGYVDTELECKQYVDGVNYLNYKVQRIFPNCSTKTELYCFLLTSLDNGDIGIPPSDFNNTNPDGTIPNPTIPPVDSNSTLTVDNSYDSVAKSNALIGQLTGDFRAYFDWQKNSNGTYEKALTDFGKDFLKVQDTTKMNNDNTNTDKIVNAINGSSTDVSGIESRLDDLISKDQNLSVDIDLNTTNTKLDQLHNDVNTTNSLLGTLVDFFTGDNNNSDILGDFEDSLPSDSWYDSKKIVVDLDTYNGDCYIESATFDIGSTTYTFPPQELIDMLPLRIVANLMMALIYIIGLKAFLRN
jgi:hypothetical protein